MFWSMYVFLFLFQWMVKPIYWGYKAQDEMYSSWDVLFRTLGGGETFKRYCGGVFIGERYASRNQYLYIENGWGILMYKIFFDVWFYLLLSLVCCTYWKMYVYLIIYWDLFMHFLEIAKQNKKKKHPQLSQRGYSGNSIKQCYFSHIFLPDPFLL